MLYVDANAPLVLHLPTGLSWLLVEVAGAGGGADAVHDVGAEPTAGEPTRCSLVPGNVTFFAAGGGAGHYDGNVALRHAGAHGLAHIDITGINTTAASPQHVRMALQGQGGRGARAIDATALSPASLDVQAGGNGGLARGTVPIQGVEAAVLTCTVGNIGLSTIHDAHIQRTQQAEDGWVRLQWW